MESPELMSPRKTESRPRIKLVWNGFDWAIEVLSISCLTVLLLITASNYGLLPDQVPNHFNWYGQPDSWTGRGSVWILPVVAFLLYGALTIINRFPYTFNYPVKITDENALRQYRIATRLIRILKLLSIASLTWINYQIIRVALNQTSGLGTYYLLIFLLTVFGAIGFLIFRSVKLK